MRTPTAGWLGFAASACLALCLVVLGAGSGRVAAAPIYKCFDKNLALVYTDEPCKDGEPLDVRAGEADPAAVAWLERQRDALDESFAQRLADQRRSAAAGALSSQFSSASVEQSGAYDNMPADTADDGPWSYPFMHRHRAHHRPHRSRGDAEPRGESSRTM